MEWLEPVSPRIIGITYNLRADYPWQDDLAEDSAAECDDPETVHAIARTLESFGQAVLIPDGPDLAGRLRDAAPTMVFNIAEGWTGRNRESLVPAVLEHMGIAYTGSDPLTLGLALDKGLAKTVAARAGIPTAPWVVCRSADDIDLPFGFPVFAKPAWEGSSKGIRSSSLVRDPECLKDMIAWITGTYGQPAIVEPFLPGREFSVGLLGNDPVDIFPVMEVRPAEIIPLDSFVYSYETKSANLERFICPADVDPWLEAAMKEMAVAVFRALDIRDLARVDIRLDASGQPMFMEVNPLPGLSSGSLYPIQAAAAGLDHGQLIREIYLAACRRTGHVLEGVA